MSTSIYNITLLFILIVIGYFLYKQLNNYEKVEGFTIGTMDTNVIGNCLITRNINKDGSVSSSVTLTSSNPSNNNILIDTEGYGWKPIDSNNNLLHNSNAIIKFDKINRIKSIIVSGIRSFKVFYSKNGDVFSYEEILYKSCNGSPLNDPSIIFEASADDGTVNINTFGNLTTTDDKPIYASYLKIVPIETRTIISRVIATGKREVNTFDSNGMKIEIMGYPNNANPDFTMISQKSHLTLVDDFRPTNINHYTWSVTTAPTNQNNNIVKLQFDKTLKINGILFQSASDIKFISKLLIKYKIEGTGIEKNINNINLCTPYNNNNKLKTNTSSQWYYFFDTPIITSELILNPIEGSTLSGITISDVYGSLVDDGDLMVEKEKEKKDYCTSDSNTDDLSNSASELLNQQLEIQQLCDTMEMQDKIKENNQKIQKNRQYLIQLEEQDRKIAALEDVVQKMKHLRMVREKTSDKNMSAEKIKQQNVESQLAQLIKDRQKNMRQLNVTLKLNDSSLNQMNQTVEKLENENGIGNNTSTTTLEGFVNPNQQKPTQITPKYEYSQGFYYRPYADSTVQTQLVESNEKPSPDLRMFGLAFNSEKVSPIKFYENKVMCNKGCDVNTKFVKMQ